MAFTSAQKRKLVSYLIQKTSEMVFPDYLGNKENPAQDDRNKAIQRALDSGDWGCQRDSVYALISAITGESFTHINQNSGEVYKSAPIVGAVVVYDVVGDGDESSGYPQGQPIYVAYRDEEGDGSGWFPGQTEDPFGEDRNWLPTGPNIFGNRDTRIRPATEEEITELVNNSDFITFLSSRMLIL